MSLLEEEELKSVAVLVFANKQDLLGAMSAAEVMKELELTSLKDRWVHVQARGAPPSPTYPSLLVRPRVVHISFLLL